MYFCGCIVTLCGGFDNDVYRNDTMWYFTQEFSQDEIGHKIIFYIWLKLKLLRFALVARDMLFI